MKIFSKSIQSILIIGILIKILGLVYKIVITRILGLEGMRLFSLIMPTLSLSLCLSSMCIPTVVNQNVAKNLIHKNTRVSTILKAAFHITFISSTLICTILLLSFPLYQLIYQNSFIYYPLLICIPLIYISNITGILRGYLEANNKFQITYLANFFEQIAKILLTFLVIFLLKKSPVEQQVLACFVCMTISEFASFGYLLFKIKKRTAIRYQNIRTEGYEKNILKQAFPLTLEQVVISVTNYLEPFLFYFAASFNSISFYDASLYYTQVTSYAIPLLIFAFFGVQSIAKFTFPKITRLKEQPENLHIILSKSFFFCFLIAAFNFMVCFFYPKEFLLLLFGDDSSSHIVYLLSVLYFFFYFNPIFVAILQSCQKEKKLLLSTVISCIVTLLCVFGLTLIPQIKTAGYIIGLGIGSFIRFLLLLIFANQEVHFKIDKKIFLSCLLLGTVYFIVNLFYHHLIYFLGITLCFGPPILLLYGHFYKNNKTTSPHKKHTTPF